MSELVVKFLLCIGVTFLLEEVQGQDLEMFMTKRRVAIEGYVMSGYGNGWKNCDILSDSLQVLVAIQLTAHFKSHFGPTNHAIIFFLLNYEQN